MTIIKLLKITAGGRHGWYATDLGFDIRKPLGAAVSFILPENQKDEPVELKKSLWQKIIEFIKKFFV